MDEIDSAIRSEACEPDSLPMTQIDRHRQRDPWADRRKGGVCHHIAPQRFDERDAGILTAPAAVGSAFVVRLRLERNTKPLDCTRIAGRVENHTGDADTRILARPDQSRKEKEMTIGATGRSRIDYPFGLLRIAGLRLHDLAQALQLKTTHRSGSRQA